MVLVTETGDDEEREERNDIARSPALNAVYTTRLGRADVDTAVHAADPRATSRSSTFAASVPPPHLEPV